MPNHSVIGERLFQNCYTIAEWSEIMELSRDRLIARFSQLHKGVHNPSARSLKDHRTFREEYPVWTQMKKRCLDPKCPDFKHYGGRGIVMYEFWQCPVFGFWLFLDHVGSRPSPQHSIDRINNELGYMPGNVRWATSEQQAYNKRSNRPKVGEKTLMQISEETGIPYATLVHRQNNDRDVYKNYNGRDWS